MNMRQKIDMPDWEAVGRHYDNKGEDDLNFLSAVDKRIVHHHSGLFFDPRKALEKEYSEEELLLTLGASEDKLTRFGGEVLGLEDSQGLDCGCGRGGSSFLLAKDYGHKMFGITVSDSQLAFATEKAVELQLDNLTSFRKLNIYKDPIHKEFDFVWACESTEYMPDHNKLFGIWNKLLKKKGQALVIAITYRESKLHLVEHELREIDRVYETKIGEFDDYIRSALNNGFRVDDLIGLEREIIPYYKLRLRTPLKRGTEEWLIKGLENGGFKYSLFLFRKE